MSGLTKDLERERCDNGNQKEMPVAIYGSSNILALNYHYRKHPEWPGEGVGEGESNIFCVMVSNPPSLQQGSVNHLHCHRYRQEE